jgi:hypothetical protein
MSRDYYIKTLRLVPHEFAYHTGAPAVAAPVFLSPMVEIGHRCLRCMRMYSTLVYQAGEVTRAQHYHETDGGIYFFIAHSPTAPAEHASRTGWIAHIKPLGASAIPDDADGTYGRAEAIHCTRISAWCVRGTPTVQPLMRRRHKSHKLDAGLLVACRISDVYPHLLVPICDQEDLLARDARLSFQIRGGAVFFSRRH